MAGADERRYRQTVRQGALVVALLSAAWGAVVLFTGGFGIRVFGILVRSHNPQRIFLITIVCAALFFVAGGRVPLAWIRRARARWVEPFHAAAPVVAAAPAPLAIALTAAALYVGFTYNTNAFGGADSFGYASQSHQFVAGGLKSRLPWVDRLPWTNGLEQFTPLGYTSRRDAQEGPLVVPMYSPGLPMLMAVAGLTGGQRAILAVVPILGAVLVLATYGIGRRLASPVAALAGTWLLFTSPAVLMMLIQPMSDVPAAAFWAIAFYFLLRGTLASQVLAGVSAGIAVLIRPNLAFGVALMVAWRVGRAIFGPPEDRRREWLMAIAVGAGALPAAVAVAVLNNYLNGSPLQSGYGDLDSYFAWEHFWPNGARYPRWFLETQTIGGLAGVAALAWPARALWPEAARLRVRSSVVLAAAFVIAVWVLYFYYLVFDAWWFQRFLLPTWPFLTIGTGAVAAWVARRTRWIGALAMLAIVIGMGVHGVRFARQNGAFDLWRGDRHYPRLAQLVRESTGPRSVILSMQHSGSIRYYGGRMTLRYDWIDANTIDRMVAWFGERGIRVYVALDEWELPEVRRRFEGQQALDRLKTPVFTYDCGAPSYFYDLSPGGEIAEGRVVRETWGPMPLLDAQTLPDLGL